MIDIKFLRENPDVVKENIKKKFQEHKLPLVDEVIEYDKKARATQQEADDLRASRNKLSKEIGALMKEGKKDEANKVKEQVTANAARLAELEELRQKAIAEAQGKKYEPVKEEIEFDDFDKIDLRSGVITKAEKHPKADKLLVFEVDLGFEKRTIVSGVAEHFKPEECVGQHVIAVVNLKPRMLRGIESRGMLLFGEGQDGKLKFAQTLAEAGSTIG